MLGRRGRVLPATQRRREVPFGGLEVSRLDPAASQVVPSRHWLSPTPLTLPPTLYLLFQPIDEIGAAVVASCDPWWSFLAGG